MPLFESQIQLLAQASERWEAKLAPFFRSCNIFFERDSCPAVSDTLVGLMSENNDKFRKGMSLLYTQPNPQVSSDLIVSSNNSEQSRDYEYLKRHWIMSVEEQGRFSWLDFFKNGNVPRSNTMLLVDRYLFEYKTDDFYRGAINVAEILNAVVPDSLDIDTKYSVLIVIDGNTLLPDHNESKNKDRKISSVNALINNKTITEHVKDALTNIKKDIRDHLRITPNAIRLDFLCIFDAGKEVKGEDKDEARSRKALFRLTHDRRIISNLFTVYATHGLDAARNGKKEKRYIFSNSNQTLLFDALLSGVGNPDQEEIMDSIPVDHVVGFLKNFSKLLNGTSTIHYCCYFSDGLDDEIKRLDINNISTPLFGSLFETELLPHFPKDKNSINITPQDVRLSGTKKNKKYKKKLRPQRPPKQTVI